MFKPTIGSVITETRVKAPDKYDYNKLVRVMKYLREKPNLDLTLEAENTHLVKWWVDAAFYVHLDMKILNGATI